jgi:hypothetical protein
MPEMTCSACSCRWQPFARRWQDEVTARLQVQQDRATMMAMQLLRAKGASMSSSSSSSSAAAAAAAADSAELQSLRLQLSESQALVLELQLQQVSSSITTFTTAYRLAASHEGCATAAERATAGLVSHAVTLFVPQSEPVLGCALQCH